MARLPVVNPFCPMLAVRQRGFGARSFVWLKSALFGSVSHSEDSRNFCIMAAHGSPTTVRLSFAGADRCWIT